MKRPTPQRTEPGDGKVDVSGQYALGHTIPAPLSTHPPRWPTPPPGTARGSRFDRETSTWIATATVTVTLKVVGAAARRRASLKKNGRTVAVLQFVGDAEKIDLPVGRYLLEYSVAHPPADTTFVVRVHCGPSLLATSGDDPIHVDAAGHCVGLLDFDVG
jgi:hypothetical protein